MIERYSRKEIKSIWQDYNRYSTWLNIEIAAAEAMEKFKIIPKGVVKKVKSKAKINPKRILQIENKVKHDAKHDVKSEVKNEVNSKVKNRVNNNVKNKMNNQLKNGVKHNEKNKVKNKVNNRVNTDVNDLVKT